MECWSEDRMSQRGGRKEGTRKALQIAGKIMRQSKRNRFGLEGPKVSNKKDNRRGGGFDRFLQAPRIRGV